MTNTATASVDGGHAFDVSTALRNRFDQEYVYQETVDGIPNLWVEPKHLCEVLRFLKNDIENPYELLFDLSAIDERFREHRADQPDSEFTVFYHLISVSGDCDLRLKVALSDQHLHVPTVEHIYPVANWYEREAYDMFGIQFDGHPNLRRILTPPLWEGYPLRKEHPARATEMDPFSMSDKFQDAQQEALKFV
ncbi:MAG: NADH-quinone oxidoreductase subunit C, partial [Gammaproteobacteria bacterium]|nr:NADH-quinone oxidoreductase subunit C [Gammaproteobacteria bacterium]